MAEQLERDTRGAAAAGAARRERGSETSREHATRTNYQSTSEKSRIALNNERGSLALRGARRISRASSGPLVAGLLPLLLLLLAAGCCLCSPPLDYLIYTSQLATAQPGGQVNVSSLLPSIESIYLPSAQANGGGGGGGGDAALARRVLSLIQNTSHTHDNNLSDLDATRYAWHLMENQAKLYMKNKVHSVREFLKELLAEAQVSNECSGAISVWLNELALLKQWATVMWNSWGNFPPAGLFEGSYTDLGSYRGCMSIQDNEETIGEPQYCMLDFEPLVPTRPRFHSIFKAILGHDGNKLTGGDFDKLSPADGSSRVGTIHTAHEFASARFSAQPKSASNVQSDSVTISSSKYSKRTIVHNATSGANENAAASQVAPLQAHQQDAADESNEHLSLKAEALVELAKKAQYFYYVKLRIGACLPSKCSQQDVRQLVQAASKRAILQAKQVNCMKKEPFSLNNYQLVAIWILSSLALVALLGTLVDVLGFKESASKSSTLVDWLMPFSIWTNAKRLFDFETAGTHGNLECVHGLRFFSMIWVIYGHTILYMEYQSFTHFFEVVETQIASFALLPTLNANFSVDTFFVISGILTTYVTWEYTKGDARKFNKFAFLISRYIRLTPQLAIVILCFFLLPLFGSGPLYKQVAGTQAELCYKNWATNLLYLQSYQEDTKLCIDPSWWLSIEMSFHFLSVLVIIVMIQNVRNGMIVNFLLALCLTLWGAIIHYTGGFAIQYLPSIPQRYEIATEQTKLFFHRPYPHAASYFIGIALGYVLATRTIKKLSRPQLVQGWLVCLAGLVVSLWGSYFWNLGAPYTQLQATLYYHLCQLLWPISIAWIILACSLGHGGFVNEILSARAFVPLGRITYMTYLSHALIIYYHSASMNLPLEPSMLLFTYLFVANTTLALLLGVLLTVVYESPILNMQKMLFTFLTNKFDPTVRGAQSLGPKSSDGEDLGHQDALTIIDDDTCQALEFNQTRNGYAKAPKLAGAANGQTAVNLPLLAARNSSNNTNNINTGNGNGKLANGL